MSTSSVQVSKDRMKKKFYDSLFSQDPRFNSVMMTKEKYDSIIADVKRIKTSMRKDSSRDYRLVERYDVLRIQGCEILIEPLSSGKNLKMFVFAEELFDIMYSVHLKLDHGRRDRMITQLNTAYKNITQNQVKLFLQSCETCQLKRGKISKPVSTVQSGSSYEGSGSVAKEDDKPDTIPLEPAIEIKVEPVDYEPSPSTSNDALNEEFILPHGENSWTTPETLVKSEFTLSVASLSSSKIPDASDDEQPIKKQKLNDTQTSSIVPLTNCSTVSPPSPVYNLSEFSNPGSSKEHRKDEFDVFGEYIAVKLRSLDRRSSAFAQKAIGDIIFEAEMGKYLNQTQKTDS